MNLTDKYKLNLPSYSSSADIEVLNENTKNIDKILSDKADKTEVADKQHTHKTTDIFDSDKSQQLDVSLTNINNSISSNKSGIAKNTSDIKAVNSRVNNVEMNKQDAILTDAVTKSKYKLVISDGRVIFKEVN